MLKLLQQCHLLALFLAALYTCALSQRYLIAPNHSCHNTTCHTLDQLAQTDLTNGVNLTLIFLPGKHTLTRLFNICNYTHVQVIGQHAAIISLHGDSKVDLSYVNQLSIESLTFTKGNTLNDSILPTERLSISNTINLFISSSYFTGLDTFTQVPQEDLHVGGNVIHVQYSVNIVIENASFEGNSGTSLNVTEAGTVSIENSTFTGNKGLLGGAVYSAHTRLTINNSIFTRNHAFKDGGAIYTQSSEVSILNTVLTNNSATIYGGGIFVSISELIGNIVEEGRGEGISMNLGGNVSITNSNLTGNYANFLGGGGGICVQSANVQITNTELTGNIADFYGGGGILVKFGNAQITNSKLIGNTATKEGGGVKVESGYLVITNSLLAYNSGSEGSAIFAVGTSKPSQVVVNGASIVSNIGLEVLHIRQSNISFVGYNYIRKNKGSIYVFDSQVYFNGPTMMNNNHGESGGAIQAIQSQLYLFRRVTIDKNTAAKYGGGIFLRESNLFSNSGFEVSNNKAIDGGAIYSYQSTIMFSTSNQDFTDFGMITINGNVANGSGGGIYATASIITVVTDRNVRINLNKAIQNGGGLYLQNSKLYIKKEQLKPLDVNLVITNNHALLGGGGIYVNDSTSGGGACTSGGDFLGECFIQTTGHLYIQVTKVSTVIMNNTAIVSGSAIYGGLLDRCTASPNAIITDAQNGLVYIKRTTKLPEGEHSISSDPLKVQPCNHSSLNKAVRKGELFQLCVKALDQVGNPVSATIHSSVVTNSGVGRLKEGQVEQTVGSECTQLEFNVFSENSSAQVEMYAEGPCNNLGPSKLILTITFLDCICPLGFHPVESKIDCSCECDQELQATKCFPEEETFLMDNKLWAGAAKYTECNHSSGYLVHDCPFDYCVPQPVNISLNTSQQISRKCAHNRSGVLCGECEEGLSLMFATSKCKECSNTYLLLLIPFAVAGIVLMILILLLNITIATGTIYGLIFYANVLAANKATFLPFAAPNFLTVFLSWVNLDLGIETCFYNSMDSQAKVLLQLVFPLYLFLLIFLIIVLSKYVNSFSNLLSNRNPVAALCTLLILSYSKLLRLIIAALQFTYLHCPDGSYGMVWLFNANVQYLSPSHIPRFVAAAVILTACVLFTTLLFFGQWFTRCSNWKVMKWTRNTKYTGFIDAFHAPFTPKHRYWPGLILFALISYNVAASMAPDTSIPVLSAGCVAGGLNAYKHLMNRVYKSRLNNALETLFLLNVMVLALGTYHFTIAKNDNNGQLALAYVSLSIAFVLFVVITCYHFYKYVLKKTNVWNNQVRPLNPARRIDFNLRRNRNYQRVDEIDENVGNEIPEVADMYGYGQERREDTDPDKYITPPIITPATRLDQLREPDLDILAPVTEEDYRQVPPIPQAENRPRPVTTMVVEI